MLIYDLFPLSVHKYSSSLLVVVLVERGNVQEA